MGVFESIKNVGIDFYRRIPPDLMEGTTFGGILSVGGGFMMFLLLGCLMSGRWLFRVSL